MTLVGLLIPLQEYLITFYTKWVKQCSEDVNKANRILGIVKWNSSHRKKERVTFHVSV